MLSSLRPQPRQHLYLQPHPAPQYWEGGEWPPGCRRFPCSNIRNHRCWIGGENRTHSARRPRPRTRARDLLHRSVRWWAVPRSSPQMRARLHPSSSGPRRPWTPPERLLLLLLRLLLLLCRLRSRTWSFGEEVPSATQPPLAPAPVLSTSSPRHRPRLRSFSPLPRPTPCTPCRLHRRPCPARPRTPQRRSRGSSR